EPMPLLGQGPDGLGEEGPLAHGHRELARARAEELAGDADEVTHVEIDEGRVAIAQSVLPRVELDLARLVPQMGEAGLTVMTEGHDPPRHRDGRDLLELLLLRVAIPMGELAAPVGEGEALPEGIDAACPERLELLEPSSDELVGLGGWAGRRGRGH